jgi:hypothetical protein
MKFLTFLGQLFCKHNLVLLVKYAGEERLPPVAQHYRCAECGKLWRSLYSLDKQVRKVDNKTS